jgi:hypothetical protein
MTRSIKGFKVDWGDRWRHSAWAERETAPKHRYWFEVSPDRTVKLLHSSSPVEEDKAGGFPSSLSLPLGDVAKE